MNGPADPKSLTAQALGDRSRDLRPLPLLSARGGVEVVPAHASELAAVIAAEKREVKPWAHFVAGGYDPQPFHRSRIPVGFRSDMPSV
jgi:hypothetical protein